MKLKDYLNSLVSKRKSTSTSSSKNQQKSTLAKAHHPPTSSTDGQYEICASEDDHHSRTHVLLARHAHLVNTIVRTRTTSQKTEISCSQCHLVHPSEHNDHRPYSSTLAMPHSEQYPSSCYPTLISSSNQSLWTKTRQRSKIRTNPWIKTASLTHHNSQVDYSIPHPIVSAGLIHSESFPQTILTGTSHSVNPPIPARNIVLRQSDSGQGFSLASSRMIDSSSPDDASTVEDQQQQLHFSSLSMRNSKRSSNVEQYFSPPSTSADSHSFVVRGKKSRYVKPSRAKRTSPNRSSIDRNRHSPRLQADQYSMDFEEIVENRRPSQVRPSPFILPLAETDLNSSSLPYAPPITPVHSRTILKHIEDIENEILLMKNLNIEPVHPSAGYACDTDRQSIHEQVNQWIEACLTTATTMETNPSTDVHTERDRLANTKEDYPIGTRSINEHERFGAAKGKEDTELMTAFYLTSMSISKRTVTTAPVKSTLECPF